MIAKPPGWTCPAIDKIATILRRNTDSGSADRVEGLRLLEELREANGRLRDLATPAGPRH